MLEAVPYPHGPHRFSPIGPNGIQFAEQPRNRNTIYSRPMRFDMICEANGIEHRLTKPNHPRTNGQVERMIKDEPHDQGHGRDRLDDRFRISRVVLLPLQERLDVMRCDQTDFMSMPRHLPGQVMRTGTGLYRNATRRLLCHEPLELRPRQLLAEQTDPSAAAP
jgi:transposase InsO family protein